MRSLKLRALTAVLAVGVPFSSWASEIPKDKSAANAANAPVSAPPSSLGGGPGAPPSEGQGSGEGRWGGMLDIGKAGAGKWWEVGGSWETHVMAIQNDLEGSGSSKLFNYAYAYGRADITRNNRLSLRMSFSERFLADETEHGLRLGDLSLTYTRRISLPKEFTLRLAGSLTAPTSYYSQKSSLISAPTVSITGARKVGWVSLEARAFGTYYFSRYTTTAGGNPNARASVGLYAEAELTVPRKYFDLFSLGAALYTEWIWIYQVGTPPVGQYGGAVADPQYPDQPVQQAYGGEVFLRFTPPAMVGIHPSITVAYAQGDPALGYSSVLHDGIAHVYGFWRLNSNFYAALSAHY